jgi:DinB superfamily
LIGVSYAENIHKIRKTASHSRGENVSTLQAGTPISATQGFRENMLNLVGSRDPLQILARTGPALSEVVSQYAVDVLRSRALEGKWTPNEIIGHLVDSEWVYGYRLRLILCEDSPNILGTSQDAWVATQRHNERMPSELVAIFETLRGFNLALVNRMSPADLERTGQHNERGPETLGVMLRLMAGHDLSHLDQIARYIEIICTSR